MTAPVIPTLPTAPSRNDAPDTFVARADAHVAALTPWTTAANSLGTYLDALGTAADTDAVTATTQAGIATTQAILAQDWAIKTGGAVSGGEYSAKYHAQLAATSAASAASSPGTQATSTSSITLGTGSKSFTLVETNKAFVVGQWVSVTNTVAPDTNGFAGTITSFNPSNGDMVVNSTNYYGSGAYTSWTIVPSNRPLAISVPIGGVKFQQDIGVTLIEPQATYLRTGTVTATATYPQAALNDYSKAFGVTANSSFIFSDFATDGNLTIVGVAGQGIASTDGGLTWNSITLPTGASGVCWTGSRFIAAGHGGSTSINLSYSTNGTSWTAGGTQTVSGAVFTGTVAIRHDGTNGVVACANGQSTWVFTTTDGSSLTPVVMGGAIAASPRIAVMPSLGANRWLITTSGNTSVYRSTAANGSAWSGLQTGPDSAVAICATSNKFIVGRANKLYYSSTGLSGSWTTVNKDVRNWFLGSADVNNMGYLINAQNALHYDGARLWVGSDIGVSATAYANSVSYTTDLTTFASWTQVQSVVVFSGAVTTSATISPMTVGSSLLMIKSVGMSSGSGVGLVSGGQACLAANWIIGPAYVGHSAPLTFQNDGTYETNRYVGYIRVA